MDLNEALSLLLVFIRYCCSISLTMDIVNRMPHATLKIYFSELFLTATESAIFIGTDASVPGIQNDYVKQMGAGSVNPDPLPFTLGPIAITIENNTLIAKFFMGEKGTIETIYELYNEIFVYSFFIAMWNPLTSAILTLYCRGVTKQYRVEPWVNRSIASIARQGAPKLVHWTEAALIQFGPHGQMIKISQIFPSVHTIAMDPKMIFSNNLEDPILEYSEYRIFILNKAGSRTSTPLPGNEKIFVLNDAPKAVQAGSEIVGTAIDLGFDDGIGDHLSLTAPSQFTSMPPKGLAAPLPSMDLFGAYSALKHIDFDFVKVLYKGDIAKFTLGNIVDEAAFYAHLSFLTGILGGKNILTRASDNILLDKESVGLIPLSTLGHYSQLVLNGLMIASKLLVLNPDNFAFGLFREKYEFFETSLPDTSLTCMSKLKLKSLKIPQTPLVSIKKATIEHKQFRVTRDIILLNVDHPALKIYNPSGAFILLNELAPLLHYFSISVSFADFLAEFSSAVVSLWDFSAPQQPQQPPIALPQAPQPLQQPLPLPQQPPQEPKRAQPKPKRPKLEVRELPRDFFDRIADGEDDENAGQHDEAGRGSSFVFPPIGTQVRAGPKKIGAGAGDLSVYGTFQGPVKSGAGCFNVNCDAKIISGFTFHKMYLTAVSLRDGKEPKNVGFYKRVLFLIGDKWVSFVELQTMPGMVPMNSIEDEIEDVEDV